MVDPKLLKTYKQIDPKDPIALAKHPCGSSTQAYRGTRGRLPGMFLMGRGLEAWRRVLEDVTQKNRV
jgi:hypothetical protein